MKEEIISYGHPNVISSHKTTIEVTKDNEISKRADCIIAVKSNKACFDLSNEIKTKLRKGKKIKIVLEVDKIKDEVSAEGSKNLILNNKKDIVIRKSDFIDDRTIAINANKAACDLNKQIIEKLKKPDKKLKMIIII